MEMQQELFPDYEIKVKHEPFDDQKDDCYTLVCYGHNLETIDKNEQMDNCYYVKDDIDRKVPVFQKLLGGCPAGKVRFSVIERRKVGV